VPRFDRRPVEVANRKALFVQPRGALAGLAFLVRFVPGGSFASGAPFVALASRTVRVDSRSDEVQTLPARERELAGPVEALEEGVRVASRLGEIPEEERRRDQPRRPAGRPARDAVSIEHTYLVVEREFAGDRTADHARADDQDLHRFRPSSGVDVGRFATVFTLVFGSPRRSKPSPAVRVSRMRSHVSGPT
jgi:hypothetical protein